MPNAQDRVKRIFDIGGAPICFDDLQQRIDEDLAEYPPSVEIGEVLGAIDLDSEDTPWFRMSKLFIEYKRQKSIEFISGEKGLTLESFRKNPARFQEQHTRFDERYVKEDLVYAWCEANGYLGGRVSSGEVFNEEVARKAITGLFKYL